MGYKTNCKMRIRYQIWPNCVTKSSSAITKHKDIRGYDRLEIRRNKILDYTTVMDRLSTIICNNILCQPNGFVDRFTGVQFPKSTTIAKKSKGHNICILNRPQDLTVLMGRGWITSLTVNVCMCKYKSH